MRLCTFDEYCPNGEHGTPFRKFPDLSDLYAPFYVFGGENKNNWVQVGKHMIVNANKNFYSGKSCWVNPEEKNLWDEPWGLQNERHSLKPGVCCAGNIYSD